MLTAIKGYYHKGQIVLKEEPPVTGKTDVIVTFLHESSHKEKGNTGKKNEIVFGSLKGKISIPDDFDEPIDDLKDYMYNEIAT